MDLVERKDLIEPKEIDVRGKTYTISKFPAVAGRMIISRYPTANMPTMSSDEETIEALLKLMAYVAVELENGNMVRLSTETLINNHVPDWESLRMLEAFMLEYNCSFFPDGSISAILDALRTGDIAKVTEILTPLLDKLSPVAKQLFTSLKQSIA